MLIRKNVESDWLKAFINDKLVSNILFSIAFNVICLGIASSKTDNIVAFQQRKRYDWVHNILTTTKCFFSKLVNNKFSDYKVDGYLIILKKEKIFL